MAYQDLNDMRRELLAAIAEGREIQYRMRCSESLVPDSWNDCMSAGQATTLLMTREMYDYREKPEGIHGYMRFNRENPSIRYGSFNDTLLLRTLRPDELCLHVELDPEDPTKIRVAEVIEGPKGEQA